MKSLGAVTTKEELLALLAKHDPEFVEFRISKTPGMVEGVFVHYNPKTKSGKFHHYISIEAPEAVFKAWEAEQPFRAAWLRVCVNGITGDVERTKYVAAKTKWLREFGYASLTEKEVEEQIDAVKSKKEFGEGLTVIGMFMKDEIV